MNFQISWLLPGSETVHIFEKDKKLRQILSEAELFTLDFNALHRVGEMEKC
jgi:hypothetical protein